MRFYCLAACALLSGCAGYQAQMLKPGAPLPASPAHVRVDAASLPFPALAAHRYDPADGLDQTEVAMLAVANNPDLKLARDDAAVSHAQAFAAGLLPDPQLALSSDIRAGADAVKARSAGLSIDTSALLLHASTRDAADDEARKTDLNLLWQEWQVASQARLLFVRQVQGRKLMAVLDQTQALFADRWRRTQQALDKGLLSSDAVMPNLSALQDIERQRFDLARQLNQNAHDLNALLGLDAEAKLELVDDDADATPDAAAVDAALSQLAQRRPDLRALEAGYAAQDQRYRGAVLAQFPVLNVGLTRARDSSGVYASGIGVTLSLPFLNRNRGNIAVEQATRQKLFDEYQQRLEASRSDVHRILAEQRLNTSQLADIGRAITELETALARSDTALRAGGVDALLYANARAALLAKQVEQINLQQAVREQGVALRTVLGVEPAAPRPSESHQP